MSSGARIPSRLLNQTPQPYWGMVDKNVPPTAVYIQGQANPPGLEGGCPGWIPIEFPAVQPFDTQDSNVQLPDDFTLLSFMASFSQAAAFAIQAYDPIRKIWFFDKPIDVRNVAGSAGFTLIQRVPYTFPSKGAMCFVRVYNQGAVVNDVMLALYGVVGGSKE